MIRICCFVLTQTGSERWGFHYQASGSLDYGNSPRATPIVADQMVFFLGAFGHLTALNLETGEVVWKRTFAKTFKVDDVSKWGVASTPIMSTIS